MSKFAESSQSNERPGSESDVLERYLSSLRQAFSNENIDSKNVPNNWPTDLRSRRIIERLAKKESIALYQVPGPKTVEEILALAGARERSSYLSENAQKIGRECREWLEIHSLSPKYEGALYEVVSNLEAGRFRSAQVLSMPIIEDILSSMMNDADQRKVTIKELKSTVSMIGLHFVPDSAYLWAYLYAAVLEVFKTKPMSGMYAASRLHRHSTVHFMQAKQFTKRNSVVATLLACSFVALWSVKTRKMSQIHSSVRHPSNTNFRKWALGRSSESPSH